eukprot:TRINITY_DN2967_c1_g1_i1.p1 TRINITY_DN2967_c1_g1~~TRINITY_DN2967_c1_g1_i1.p1  ORF type:complete len:528 (-),score=89.44 TRINITY_DN2967_c1_g1_i1:1087-2670(-)
MQSSGYLGYAMGMHSKPNENVAGSSSSSYMVGGAPGLSSYNPYAAFNTTNVKPLRTNFKMPEGVYNLKDEITINPPKTQRKIFRPIGPSKISFVWAKDEKDEKTSNILEYFTFNSGEYMPIYKLNEVDFECKEKPPPMPFRLAPTAHAFNPTDCTTSSVQILIGFETGDLFLHEPMDRTYTEHFNKEPRMNTGSVTHVAWVPNDKNLFVVAFSNGVLLVLDKEREDQPLPRSESSAIGFSVSKHKVPRNNPVSRWNVSDKPLTCAAFSPDGVHLAVTCQDGYLRVFHFMEERLVVSFRSYFGGLRTVAWSPDGKCLLTGGEDDLVCLFSFTEHKLLARCVGHKSWVSKVAFDPYYFTDENRLPNTYRFGSVGEDCRLLLWDFTVTPATAIHHSIRRERILSISMGRNNVKTDASSSVSGSGSSSTDDKARAAPVITVVGTSTPPPSVAGGILVEAVGRNCVPTVYPTVSHRAHHEPLSDLVFLKNLLITCSWGKVKIWDRPVSPKTEEAKTIDIVINSLPSDRSEKS